MNLSVDKIVSNVMEQFRPLIVDAVRRADTDARGEMVASFKKAIDGTDSPKASALAPSASGKKRGRPKKDVSLTVVAKPKKEKKVKAKSKSKKTDDKNDIAVAA
jgi:hypothetical protein